MTKGGVNGNVHHCGECKQPVRARCIRLGHVAPCEDTSCKGFFQVYKGCIIHPYSEGYNLGFQKKQKGRKRSLASDENGDEDDALIEPEEAATNAENSDDAEAANEENPDAAQKVPVALAKSNSTNDQQTLSEVPEGGWNQNGLEQQPHARNKRDKKSIHTAATASQVKKKSRKARRNN